MIAGADLEFKAELWGTFSEILAERETWNRKQTDRRQAEDK